AEGRIHGVVLVFRDVTEQERLEEELRRASTLESVGVLAGGIAHDFNNILTGILANLSLARLHTSPGDRVHVRLGEAEKAALRARDLTQQLLTFAKGGAPVKKATSLADVVRDSTAFVLSGSNVSPRFVVEAEPWVVEADAGQLSQVVQNLVLNAQQAMPEGGTLEIRLSNAALEGPTGMPLGPGRYVRLDVVDTGVGIAPQHLPRVFDPFFTTKQKGSGLGLATAYAIVRKHDGHIAVRSQLGQGTALSVYLPAAPTVTPAPVAVPPLPTERGAGRVLVMDDDALIRETAEALLGELGYAVTLARDGAEAIRVYRAALDEGQPFDAVVLDLTVPGGMGGRQAIEELRRVDPEIRAVVSSGYSEDPVMADFRRHGFTAVMAKPYTIQEMSAVLGRVVGPPEATA
ncbi:MAG: ATP-binding protein, partial [Myxococcota bacterium]